MNPEDLEDLPQPPEGVLHPTMPWSRINPNSRLWLILKSKLTGRRQGDEHYTSYVNLSDADADRLIANLKKDPRGYPSLDQESGTPVQWMERQRLYQEWLVEDYLEKPFREQTNKKIEEAAVESRLNEIQEQKKKDKESVSPPPANEKEQEELDQDQEVLQDKIDDLVEDIDSIDESQPEEEQKQQEQKENKEEKEQTTGDKDLEKIKGSLEEIKGSLKIQASDLETVNQNTSGSISTLESLKQLFQAHTDILRRQAEQAQYQAEETASEATVDTSANAESADLTGDNKAKGVIQGVDGDILTIKTTEGEFRQGETITQGDGGGGFLDMIKGIAGKFLGKGKGGGASPTKMSSGGYSKSATPLASGGTLQPGVYNRPTRGNLGLNQMAIPLNRNVGKPFRKPDDKRLRKFDQPLIDVMSQPLKAIGLSILSIAGNFIRALGPLGGFFLPYAKGLVKGFAAILGVPIGIVMSLLGGPAYAAAEQQDQQQNIFAKLWDSLMKKFGFDLGSGDDEKKKKKRNGNTPSTATGKWGPLLDVIASGEGNYDSVNPGLKRPEILDMSISELVAFQHSSKAKDGGTAASGRYQMLHPESYAQNAGLSMDEKFSPENQDKMAAAYIEKRRGGNDWLAGKLTDEDFGKELAKEWAALEYPGKGGGFYDGDGRNQAKVSWDKVKAVLPQVKAEEGVQIKVKEEAPMGKFMGWQILDGPVDGYKVSDNLEMHGKEAYLQHENGFSILPIENKEYSLSKDPLGTLDRWKEILGPSGKVSDSGQIGGYAQGGSRVFDPKQYREGAESSKHIQVGAGDKARSYTLLYKKEGASGNYTIKAISKKVSGNLFTGDKLTSVNPASAEGQAVLASTNVKKYFKERTARSLQLNIKLDPDASIYYGYNQEYQTTKDAWLKKGVSQDVAEQYAAAAAKEFAVTKKSGSFLPGSKEGLDSSLSNVTVTGGDTSTASNNQSKSDDPFTALKTAISGMLIGAGIDALKPKNKEEYDRMKSELESTFKVVEATSTTPSPPKSDTSMNPPVKSPPTIVPPPQSPAPTNGPVAEPSVPFDKQLDDMTALYYA